MVQIGVPSRPAAPPCGLSKEGKWLKHNGLQTSFAADFVQIAAFVAQRGWLWVRFGANWRSPLAAGSLAVACLMRAFLPKLFSRQQELAGAPYRIAKLAKACMRSRLVLARTCTVSRGGPLGGQHGKDFSPPKIAQRLPRTTPRVALDPLRRCLGLG